MLTKASPGRRPGDPSALVEGKRRQARHRRVAEIAPWLHFETGQQFDITETDPCGLGAGLPHIRRIMGPLSLEFISRSALVLDAYLNGARLILRGQSYFSALTDVIETRGRYERRQGDQ